MKRTASIVLGIGFASLLAGCQEDPEPEEVRSDHSEVCVNREMTILPEDQCDDDEDRHRGHGFIFLPGSTYVGPHGSKYTGLYSTVRPTSGTIGRVPATGGFGTHTGTGG